MKMSIVAALLGAGFWLVSAVTAFAAEKTIKVSNASSSVFTEIYVSPPDLGDYGENLLGGVTRIQGGASANVTFDTGGGCIFDFQAVTGDDDMFTASAVDICAGAEVTLPRH